MPTLELTEQQIKYVQSVLHQDKPSRTRLTSEEKGMIVFMCRKWLEDYCGNVEDDKLIKSIIKKLK